MHIPLHLSLSLSLSLYSDRDSDFMEMEEVKGQPLPIMEAMDGTVPKTPLTDNKRAPNFARYMRTSVFLIFALFGQSVATLLGRLYFNEGGNSKWMGAVVQTAGFPVLIPFLFLYQKKKHTTQNNHTSEKPSLPILLSLYLVMGIILAAICTFYSIGLAYLSVSTFSLISATQLAFTATFSYFLNSQKFTPFIVNSLVLVTISSTLLVFQNNQSESSISSSSSSKTKFAIGFICAICSAASNALSFSLTQLVFRKILTTPTFRKVLGLIICQNFVATCLILIGLFASREWKGIPREMESYKLGRVSYVITLVATAMSWEVSAVGVMGLIFEVSSLFSNVITTLGLPIVPIFAVAFFHDKMNGVKVISLMLAIWGSASYIYQHYLDELEFKKKVKEVPSSDIA